MTRYSDVAIHEIGSMNGCEDGREGRRLKRTAVAMIGMDRQGVGVPRKQTLKQWELCSKRKGNNSEME